MPTQHQGEGSMPYFLTRWIIFYLGLSLVLIQTSTAWFVFFSAREDPLLLLSHWYTLRYILFLNSSFQSITSLDPQPMNNICCLWCQLISLSAALGTSFSNTEHSPGTKNQSCTSFLDKTTRYPFKAKRTNVFITLPRYY